ncbi:hypothetical protein, partial [Hyphomicrobium sp.]|uniref:hypothetical protein n=1 Tax=Hyphomicrobium sp. TaxID=82 RepID=UPI0025C2C5A8
HESAEAALEPAAWSATPLAASLSVGDRITISSGKGERVLEVVAIAEVEPAPVVTRAAGAPPPARKVTVTCRDTSSPDGQLVTFEVPADATPGAAGRPLI